MFPPMPSTTPQATGSVLEYESSESTGPITSQQWKSGIAAWLGWLFDGLDMHLYTIVATPFVAVLLHTSAKDPQVNQKASWIQAAFLIGWALGGGFFGRLGDKLGRARALGLTVLTYALFTGLSAAAQTWWQLMIFRFVAALGIGGEWAVGSSLLSETWPRRWRCWIAAVLQTAVNLGVLLAVLATSLLASVPQRYVFLVGVLPALLVFWIRRSVPEPEEWHSAKLAATEHPPMSALFQGTVRRTTILTIIVCACSLTAWWGIMFWTTQLVRSLPDVRILPEAQRNRLAGMTLFLLVGPSIAGNFIASAAARVLGYRKGVALMCLAFFLSTFGAYYTPRGHVELFALWLPLVGISSGIFGLFTMYLPPLFPTLLRTTGAGFSYNIGRLAAAVGTVIFGILAQQRFENNLRVPLMYSAFLFIPAMIVAMMLPDLRDR